MNAQNSGRPVPTDNPRVGTPTDATEVAIALANRVASNPGSVKLIAVPEACSSRDVAQALAKMRRLTLVDADDLAKADTSLFIKHGPEGTNGFIVAGYDPLFLLLGEHRAEPPGISNQEWRIQAFVRSEATRLVDGHKIIVISDGLPRGEAFSAEYPWYNGPFDRLDIWEVRTGPDGMSAVNVERQALTGKWIDQPYVVTAPEVGAEPEGRTVD